MIFQDVLDHLEVEPPTLATGCFMRMGWLGQKKWVSMVGNILSIINEGGFPLQDYEPSKEDKKADDWKRYYDAPKQVVTETVQSSIEPQTSEKSDATVAPKYFGTPKEKPKKRKSRRIEL